MRDAMHGGHDTASLPAAWRERAELLRRHGAMEASQTTSQLADELEATLRTSAMDPLTLSGAAEVSGLSIDTIGRMVRDGRLANVGRKHAPRVRRGDLPRSTRLLRNDADGSTFPPLKAAIARAIVRTKET